MHRLQLNGYYVCLRENDLFYQSIVRHFVMAARVLVLYASTNVRREDNSFLWTFVLIFVDIVKHFNDTTTR